MGGELAGAAGGGAFCEAIDELWEGDAGVFGCFGEQADGRESREGIDFEEKGIEGGVDHDIDSGEVDAADDLVGGAGDFLALGEELGREAGIEAVLSFGVAVLGVVVEEGSFRDDADGREGLFFEDADGEFGSLDELFDEDGGVFLEDYGAGVLGFGFGFADKDIDGASAVEGFYGAGRGDGAVVLVVLVEDLEGWGGESGGDPGVFGGGLIDAEAGGFGA